ncbi:MAG: DUF3738 domain-containing protein [Granulicella sp.]
MSYYEQLQSLYRRYEKDGHMQPFTMHDLASWAYDNGLCQPQRSTIASSDEMKTMVRRLLGDRFRLVLRAKKVLPVYAVVVKKHDQKLTKSTKDPNGIPSASYSSGW